jgi:hypothetical protein
MPGVSIPPSPPLFTGSKLPDRTAVCAFRIVVHRTIVPYHAGLWLNHFYISKACPGPGI